MLVAVRNAAIKAAARLELIIVTCTFDAEARQRSYTLLAEAFALNGRRC